MVLSVGQIIESERCITRLPSEDDTGDIKKFLTSPDFLKEFPWFQEDADNLDIPSIIDLATRKEWWEGYIFLNSTKELVGNIVLFEADKGLEFPLELSINMAKEYRGLGLAYEVVTAMRDVVFSTSDCLLIGARVDVGNDASLSLFKKAGFEESFRKKQLLGERYERELINLVAHKK